MRVLWYVHHVGAGHLTRLRACLPEFAERGHEVVVAGSAVDGMDGLHSAHGLPLDVPADARQAAEAGAGGALHWAPLHHEGYAARMSELAALVARHRPDVAVVDVSVEVTALLRLLGLPVVAVVQPGSRVDPPHALGHRLASALAAPWPAGLADALDVAPGASPVVHVGGLTPRARVTRAGRAASGRGLVLGGLDATGSDLPARLARAVPELTWSRAGGDTWRSDIETALDEADVVVTHAGLGALADLAARDVPAVVCPQPRPHDEQRRLAAALARAGWAQVVRDGGLGGDGRRDASRVSDDALRDDALNDDALGDAVRRALHGPSLQPHWGLEGAAAALVALVERVEAA